MLNQFNQTTVRALALDLDGTIINEGNLCPGVVDILARISDLGVEIILATGRPRRNLPHELLAMPYLRYIVTLNGTCVSNCKNKQYISCLPLDYSSIKKLLHFTAEDARFAHLMCDDKVFISPACEKKMRECATHLWPEEMIGDIFQVVDSPIEYVQQHAIIINKLVLNCGNLAKSKVVLAKIAGHFNVESAIMENENVELTAPGISKATGVELLCKHLGFSMHEVVAIGDSGNDALMLQAVGYSIAMGNASDEIKSLAHMVAPCITENGAVHVLEQLFFNNR